LNGLLALFLVPAAIGLAAAAPDPYREIRPIVGTWTVDASCSSGKYRLGVSFTETKRGLTGKVVPADERVPAADVTIIYIGPKGRYQVDATMKNSPVFQALGLSTVRGNLTVADDEEDEESPGRDKLFYSLNVNNFLTATVDAKLKEKYRKAGFIFKSQSPMGRDNCQGSAVKLDDRKKR
jgi:hypothetical protein